MDHEGLVKAAAVCREKCCERLIGEVVQSWRRPLLVLNVNALVGAFNQALVKAFSVIVKTDCETDGSFYSTTYITH